MPTPVAYRIEVNRDRNDVTGLRDPLTSAPDNPCLAGPTLTSLRWCRLKSGAERREEISPRSHRLFLDSFVRFTP